MKNKQGENVREAFQSTFKYDRAPENLWTDNGTEFYNKHVKDLLGKNKITLYSTENEEKSGVVEKWNRTIKNKMWKLYVVVLRNGHAQEREPKECNKRSTVSENKSKSSLFNRGLYNWRRRWDQGNSPTITDHFTVTLDRPH